MYLYYSIAGPIPWHWWRYMTAQMEITGQIERSLAYRACFFLAWGHCFKWEGNRPGVIVITGLPDHSLPTLGNLSALQSLDVSFNRLTGALPDTLGSLPGLITLDVSSNGLSSLPDLTGLTNLDSLAIDQLGTHL